MRTKPKDLWSVYEMDAVGVASPNTRTGLAFQMQPPPLSAGFVFACVLPSVVVAGVVMLADDALFGLDGRLLAAGALAISWLLLSFALCFFRNWLYTGPRVSPQMRERPKPLAAWPAVLAACLATGFIFYGRTRLEAPVLLGGAVGGLAGFALLSSLLVRRGTSLWQGVRDVGFSARVLAGYPDADRVAPGVWAPRSPRGVRVAVFPVAVGLLALALLGVSDGLDAWPRVALILTAPVMLALALIAALLEAQRLRFLTDGIRDRDGRLFRDGETDSRSAWEGYYDRLRTSQVEYPSPSNGADPVREQDHLLLGTHPDSGQPVLLDRSVIDNHVYIQGRTGAGKTSLSLMPMLTQLIRGTVDANGKLSAPKPIVIIDLKGDLALLRTVIHEAKHRGTPENPQPQAWRIFSNDRDKAAHHFNPIDSFSPDAREPIDLANILMQALGMDYGAGYGRQYFEGKNRRVLAKAHEHGSRPRSFREIRDALIEQMRSNKRAQELEILDSLESLASYRQLDTTESSGFPIDQVIDMRQALQDRQIIYFFLRSTAGSMATREIANLAIWALLIAGGDRRADAQGPGERVRSYLFIDEFQQVVGSQLKTLLTQASGADVSLVLANQSESDLDSADYRLRDLVLENTTFHQHYSVYGEKRLREMMSLSGEEMNHLQQWSSSYSSDGLTGRAGWSSGSKEQETTFLSANDIISATRQPRGAIAYTQVSRGLTRFYGRPFKLDTHWPLSKEEYLVRQSAPLPTVKEVTGAVSEAPKADVVSGEGPAMLMEGEFNAFLDALSREEEEQARALGRKVDSAEEEKA